MALKKANPVRKIVRTILAAIFWLYPLLKISPFHLPGSWQVLWHRATPDVLLILFISYYALLSEGGWLSVAFDLAFIYFWPLFIIWIGIKHSSVRLYKLWKQSGLLPRVEIAGVSDDSKKNTVEKPYAIRELLFGNKMIARILRPFTQFVLLWSLLILHTSNWVLTWVALIVIAVGAVKVVRNLSLFLGDAGSWINKLKSGFALQTAQSIAQIRTYSQGSDPDAFRTSANTLHMYEVMFRYMAEQKEKLVKWSLIAAILITVPFYLYLSFIFTSIYLGVARLNHVTWSWTDALTTAIFIPFAFTDLPHNLWIRIIGGLQAVTVTILGYTVLFRRIQHSVQQISQAATELYVPLNDESLKTTVALLNVIKIKPNKEPTSSF